MAEQSAIDSRFTTVSINGRVMPDHRIVIFPEDDGSWLAALYQRNATAALATLVPDAAASALLDKPLIEDRLMTRDGWFVVPGDETGTEWCWLVTPPPSRGG